MQENKVISTYRQSLRDKIMDTAMHAFAQHGIRAVKMDDIAQQLGISKRTLYEIYENKELVLFEGVKHFKSLRERELSQRLGELGNVMDIILYIYKVKVDEFGQVNPAFYADIEKYPLVKRYLEEDKKNGSERFQAFLRRGVSEGYFQPTLDYTLVAQMFDGVMQHVVDKKTYCDYSIKEIFENIIFVMLRGICTPKGVAALDVLLRDSLTNPLDTSA